ncbi:MAG: (Fe-S)-binding protein [Bacteroidetes bacterium]|nr:(Fe-S)-binding protein [Bacteroidota bacterium]
MEVDIFIPCYIDLLYPETGFNMVKVLEKLGCKVYYNTNQTCCGQPAFNAGYKKEAFKVAKKFINDFSGNRYIVSPSASCIKMVKDSYEDFFLNSSQRNHYKKIQNKAIEFTSFLTDILKKKDVGAVFEAKVCYHDSCSAHNGMGIKKGPRELLKYVKGLELIEMNESETCCGFGGTFSVKMEPISIAMVDQKSENALATGADYIVSTDTSCLMHIDGYLQKQNKKIKVMHIADVLAQGY